MSSERETNMGRFSVEFEVANYKDMVLAEHGGSSRIKSGVRGFGASSIRERPISSCPVRSPNNLGCLSEKKSKYALPLAVGLLVIWPTMLTSKYWAGTGLLMRLSSRTARMLSSAQLCSKSSISFPTASDNVSCPATRISSLLRSNSHLQVIDQVDQPGYDFP